MARAFVRVLRPCRPEPLEPSGSPGALDGSFRGSVFFRFCFFFFFLFFRFFCLFFFCFRRGDFGGTPVKDERVLGVVGAFERGWACRRAEQRGWHAEFAVVREGVRPESPTSPSNDVRRRRCRRRSRRGPARRMSAIAADDRVTASAAAPRGVYFPVSSVQYFPGGQAGDRALAGATRATARPRRRPAPARARRTAQAPESFPGKHSLTR